MFVLLKVQSLQLSFRPAGVSLGGGGGGGQGPLRPPPLATPLGMSVLETQLGNIVNIDKHELVVMGDLNLDCTNKESETYKMINDICEGFSLKRLIQTPTRITCDHSAILDLILTNVVNTSKSGVIDYKISDHPLFL